MEEAKLLLLGPAIIVIADLVLSKVILHNFTYTMNESCKI